MSPFVHCCIALLSRSKNCPGPRPRVLTHSSVIRRLLSSRIELVFLESVFLRVEQGEIGATSPLAAREGFLKTSVSFPLSSAAEDNSMRRRRILPMGPLLKAASLSGGRVDDDDNEDGGELEGRGRRGDGLAEVVDEAVRQLTAH